MKETVTVTVRTDSEGVTGRGRGSLSPVVSGFVPIAGGHGVATQDPDDLTGGIGDDVCRYSYNVRVHVPIPPRV